MSEKILLAWSGGKDSAMALYTIQHNPEFEIAALLTTVTEGYERISMHGVRRELLELQAEVQNLPLVIVYISQKSSNDEYEQRMKDILSKYKDKGIKQVVFGDIFLEDVRSYREEKLAKIGMEGIFPLWKKNTTELASEFVRLGFKAIVTCVDSKHLDSSFVGRIIDEKFLASLPENCDPCGENGEFHTFVYDGPIISKPIKFEKGDVVLREERFWYCDLIL